MDLAKMNFKRLGYDNFETWKLRARQVLTREGLWSYVIENPPAVKTRTSEWITKDELALQTIGFLVEDPQLRLINDAKTANEAWMLLKQYYVKDSSAGKVALIKKLSKTELSESGDMRKHLVEFEELFEKIENVGCQMTEDMKAAFILASLPESYESTVAAIQGRMEIFTMSFVKTKLLEEYERRKEKFGREAEEQKAMVSKINRRPTGDTKRLCYVCESPDHLARNCDLLKNIRGQAANSVGNSGRTQSAKVVQDGSERGGYICFAALQEESKNAWYLDSGASAHMTGRAEQLDSYEDMKMQNVTLANGNVLTSEARGGVNLRGVNQNGFPVTVALKNVLVVPGLSANLISVKIITEKGFDVKFGINDCCVMKNGQVIVVGEKIGSLYRLNKVDCLE